MNIPAFNPACIGIVTRIYLYGPAPDRLPLFFISLARDGRDRSVSIDHLDSRLGAHVVVPARSVRLAEAGPDDRHIFAYGDTEQRGSAALPGAGTGRGDGQDRKSRHDSRQSDPAPAQPNEGPIDVMQAPREEPRARSRRSNVLHRHLRCVGFRDLILKSLGDPHLDSVKRCPADRHHKRAAAGYSGPKSMVTDTALQTLTENAVAPASFATICVRALRRRSSHSLSLSRMLSTGVAVPMIWPGPGPGTSPRAG